MTSHEWHGVSNHWQLMVCPHFSPFCEWNPPVTGGFPLLCGRSFHVVTSSCDEGSQSWVNGNQLAGKNICPIYHTHFPLKNSWLLSDITCYIRPQYTESLWYCTQRALYSDELNCFLFWDAVIISSPWDIRRAKCLTYYWLANPLHIDGLKQERRYSSALAMELRLFLR